METEPQETEPQETEPQETEPQETEPQETEPQETEPQETEPQETTPESKYQTIKNEYLSKFITYLSKSINNVESQNCIELLSTDFDLIQSSSKLFFELNKKLIKEKDESLKNKIISFTSRASLDLNLITNWDVCWNYFKEIITFYFIDVAPAIQLVDNIEENNEEKTFMKNVLKSIEDNTSINNKLYIDYDKINISSGKIRTSTDIKKLSSISIKMIEELRKKCPVEKIERLNLLKEEILKMEKK